jgi:hypothetical protein
MKMTVREKFGSSMAGEASKRDPAIGDGLVEEASDMRQHETNIADRTQKSAEAALERLSAGK